MGATNVQDLAFTTLSGAGFTNGGSYTVSLKVGDADAVSVTVEAASGGAVTKDDVATAIQSVGIEGLSVETSSSGLKFTVDGGENFSISESASTGVTTTGGPG